MQLAAVGMQFLCYNCLIYRAEVYAALVAQHGVDVQSVKYACQQADIVQVELREVFAFRLNQWEAWIAYRLNGEGYAGVCKVFEFISIIGELLVSSLVLDALHDDSLLLVLHV